VLQQTPFLLLKQEGEVREVQELTRIALEYLIGLSCELHKQKDGARAMEL